MRQRALAADVALVDVRQRLGHLNVALHGLQTGARRLVLGWRGGHAQMPSLGGQVEAVVHALGCPMLTVSKTLQAGFGS